MTWLLSTRVCVYSKTKVGKKGNVFPWEKKHFHSLLRVQNQRAPNMKAFLVQSVSVYSISYSCLPTGLQTGASGLIWFRTIPPETGGCLWWTWRRLGAQPPLFTKENVRGYVNACFPTLHAFLISILTCKQEFLDMIFGCTLKKVTSISVNSIMTLMTL